MRWTAKKVIPATGAVILIVALFFLHRSTNEFNVFSGKSSRVQAARRQEIIGAFQHAWDGYAQHCFGRDTLHPGTNSCDDEFGGYGATAIDALSTAIMFRKEATVNQILRYIATIDWKKVKGGGGKIQLFEVTIRHFAAMLSAYDLLDGPYSDLATDPSLRKALYDKMIALGDVLTCAFETKTGIPRGWVNPANCTTDRGTTNTIAGAGTLILEFARLSDITANKKYVTLARKAEEYLLTPKPPAGEPYPGLLGGFVGIQDGGIVGESGSWGALSDSFYEYLLKAYLYDNEMYANYLDRWSTAADSTIRSIGSHPYGHPEWTLLPSWDATGLRRSMEALAWFAGGNIILGGMVTDNATLVAYGLSIADAAGAVYALSNTGLGGEWVKWETTCETTDAQVCDASQSLRLTDGRYQLRPEVLETWYYAYRATNNPKYREWTWLAFEAIQKYCRTPSGYGGLVDVNVVTDGHKLDKQESFVLAGVFKYAYLTHLDDKTHPVQVFDSRSGVKNTWVFNTEAHPFRVAGTPV